MGTNNSIALLKMFTVHILASRKSSTIGRAEHGWWWRIQLVGWKQDEGACWKQWIFCQYCCSMCCIREWMAEEEVACLRTHSTARSYVLTLGNRSSDDAHKQVLITREVNMQVSSVQNSVTANKTWAVWWVLSWWDRHHRNALQHWVLAHPRVLLEQKH